MVEEATEAPPTTEEEEEKVKSHDVHIYMPTDAWERAKELSDYAADEGIIEGHPKGNLTAYTNFSYNLAEQYLREYALKKRGYR